jgi:hypothetical protein
MNMAEATAAALFTAPYQRAGGRLRQPRCGYRCAAEPKELLIVPNAGQVDLYDRVNLIPFDKPTDFFRGNLS